MDQLLNNYSYIIVFLSTLTLILSVIVLGYFFGVRRRLEEGQESIIQTAMLTLLALLLAFGVSMAEIRFEARKQGEIDESNAIGTTYLRAGLLPAPSGEELQKILKAYLDMRIEFYQVPHDEPASSPWGHKLNGLEQAAWSIAGREIVKKPTVEKSLLLTSMNQAFDLSDKQTFTFMNQVPFSIIGMLYLASVIVCCLMGYLHAKKASHQRIAILSLAVLITMTLTVILDLDRPRKGLIRVLPDSLTRLRVEIQS